MKRIFTMLVLVAISYGVHAQIRVGAGLAIDNPLGIALKAQKDITEQIDADVMFTYFFTQKVTTILGTTSTSLFHIDLNGHYNLDLTDEFITYGLAGLNLSFFSTDVLGAKTSGSNIGLNLGAGIRYSLSSLDLWAEPKVVIGDATGFLLHAGVMIPFGDL